MMLLAWSPAARSWRTPIVIVLCGCLIAILTFGPRTTIGLLLPPMTRDMGWTRDVFAFAIAIQHLVWGIGQPFGGAVADRLGIVRALSIGAILYSAGLVLMASATTPATLFSAGALIGFGLSGASYNIVLAAFGKLLPEASRPLAIGIGGAAGSFGQFLFSPFCVLLLDLYGWRTTLLVFGAMLLLVLPLSLPLTTAAQIRAAEKAAVPMQSVRRVFGRALQSPSYVLLICGFFVSGFHVAFINLHLPAHLQDGGLDRPSAGWVIAMIGLFNIVGSIGVGWLCGRHPKRFVLSWIYFLRALAIALFLLMPLSPGSALLFAAAMGMLWVCAVIPVSGLIAGMFGTQHLAALYGLAYFFHQVGASAGVWAGGLGYEWTGSYNVVWWWLAAAALATSALTLAIKEQPRDPEPLPRQP
jgi:predicted MFS family arabinose efflux permease